MSKDIPSIHILLVDDEAEFRQSTSVTLGRRGFKVSEAADGLSALEAVKQSKPDLLILDIKMPGMDGIETLKRIRQFAPKVPAIILTGHGDYDTAMAGIKLEIVDFIHKPIDIDELGIHIQKLLSAEDAGPLRERTIAAVMATPNQYPRIYIDQSVGEALEILKEILSKPVEIGERLGQVRSALVYERNGDFITMIRFTDLLKITAQPFLFDSPYTTFFTGMFLAQCKAAAKWTVRELVGDERHSIRLHAPLMEAVHLLVKHKLINLPVIESGNLVGVLRARDLVLEIQRIIGRV